MIKLNDYAEEIGFDCPMLAKVNNKLRELHFEVDPEKDDLEFLGISNPDGYRTYSRTLKFIFIKACNELYPNQKVEIEHTLCRKDGLSHNTILHIMYVLFLLSDWDIIHYML